MGLLFHELTGVAEVHQVERHVGEGALLLVRLHLDHPLAVAHHYVVQLEVVVGKSR